MNNLEVLEDVIEKMESKVYWYESRYEELEDALSLYTSVGLRCGVRIINDIIKELKSENNQQESIELLPYNKDNEYVDGEYLVEYKSTWQTQSTFCICRYIPEDKCGLEYVDRMQPKYESNFIASGEESGMWELPNFEILRVAFLRS